MFEIEIISIEIVSGYKMFFFCFPMSGQRLSDDKSLEPPPSRRYMGITMLTLTDHILAELRQRSHTVSVDVKSGVLIWKVIIGSPAYK